MEMITRGKFPIPTFLKNDRLSSKTHSAETIQRLAHTNNNINIVIIVVGTLQSRGMNLKRSKSPFNLHHHYPEQLQAICSATARGHLIDIDDKEGVGQAIGQAFEEVGSMMDAGVETYNFKADE